MRVEDARLSEFSILRRNFLQSKPRDDEIAARFGSYGEHLAVNRIEGVNRVSVFARVASNALTIIQDLFLSN